MGSEPVERLAAESAAARTRISATIDEIQERLDPRRIVGEAVGKATDNGRQALTAVTETAKAHPLALLAGAAAIGLALLARDRLSKATVDLGDHLGAYTDYDDGFGYDEAPLAAVSDDADAPPKRPIVARAGETVAGSPIMAIVAGLAAGAALGALFPATDAERRVLGTAGSRLGDAARRAADGLGKRS